MNISLGVSHTKREESIVILLFYERNKSLAIGLFIDNELNMSVIKHRLESITDGWWLLVKYLLHGFHGKAN